MLENLIIENFAIIEKVDLQFEAGMSVLTGETGAGFQKLQLSGADGRLGAYRR